MRLPLATVYRAFPELDRFTDEQCARLGTRARARNRIYREKKPDVRFLGVASILLAIGMGECVIWGMLDGPETHRLLRHSLWLEGVARAAFAVPIIAAGGVGLWLRDQSLRRLVKDQIERTKCPKCSASLLGSQRSADSVRCDACGAIFEFVEIGLRSEDLGPPLIMLTPDTTCAACRYAIAGLPINRGFVVCPECGERTPVVEQGVPIEAGDEE